MWIHTHYYSRDHCGTPKVFRGSKWSSPALHCSKSTESNLRYSRALLYKKIPKIHRYNSTSTPLRAASVPICTSCVRLMAVWRLLCPISKRTTEPWRLWLDRVKFSLTSSWHCTETLLSSSKCGRSSLRANTIVPTVSLYYCKSATCYIRAHK